MTADRRVIDIIVSSIEHDLAVTCLRVKPDDKELLAAVIIAVQQLLTRCVMVGADKEPLLEVVDTLRAAVAEAQVDPLVAKALKKEAHIPKEKVN